MKKIFCLFATAFLSAVIFAQSAVSADDYALTFFNKLNDTQKKLTYLNKKNALEKVGTETVNGDISGTLFYDVKVKGMGAVVTIRYTNYCDENGWVYDGEIITHSNMAQNGNFSGTIKVSGDSPAEVTYDKLIMKKGKPAEGVYLLNRPGQDQEEVSYSVYLKSIQ